MKFLHKHGYVKHILCMFKKDTENKISPVESFLPHTCTHNVISEEWCPKPKGQHEEVAGDAREQLFEACGVGTKIGKRSCHQHTMRMKANNIVLPGVQVSCLHQLREDKNRSDHLILSKRGGNKADTLIFNSIFDTF